MAPSTSTATAAPADADASTSSAPAAGVAVSRLERAEPPASPRLVWLDGELVPAGEAKVSVYDHGLLYGDGVFEGIRVYGGRVFKLATHLTRLAESAKAIRLELSMSVEALDAAVRQTVEANDCRDGYVRLCVTRGAGTLGLHPFKCPRPSTFIICDAIKLYPQELYDQGLAIITASTIRNHPGALSPRIKSMNYLNNILAKIEAIDAGVLEAVMLDHRGLVSECTGDNIFVVRPIAGKPTLITPPLHAGILDGVTRNVVLQLAEAAGLPVREADLTRHDLYTADEMFLTGTAAEVIPVTSVDQRTIGDGRVGGITKRLIGAFRELVAANAPED
jgi:branched-chain amino acid aminotransferase